MNKGEKFFKDSEAAFLHFHLLRIPVFPNYSYAKKSLFLQTSDKSAKHVFWTKRKDNSIC
jgi:hypothetical protein